MPYTAAMKSPLRILLATAICGLTACGYKGPLYHPDARPEAVESAGGSPRGITLPAPQRQKEDLERDRGRERRDEAEDGAT